MKERIGKQTTKIPRRRSQGRSAGELARSLGVAEIVVLGLGAVLLFAGGWMILRAVGGGPREIVSAREQLKIDKENARKRDLDAQKKADKDEAKRIIALEEARKKTALEEEKRRQAAEEAKRNQSAEADSTPDAPAESPEKKPAENAVPPSPEKEAPAALPPESAEREEKKKSDPVPKDKAKDAERTMPRALPAKWFELSILWNDARSKSDRNATLAKLPAVPTNTSLSIRGLAEANEMLEGTRTKLSFEPDKLSKQGISVKYGTKSLVRFFLSDATVKYAVQNYAEEPIAALAQCVLEIKGDEGAAFIALHEPLRISKLPLKNGVAEIGLSRDSQRNVSEMLLDRLARYELFLGEGRVHVAADRDEPSSFAFAKVEGEDVARKIPLLAEKYQFESVEAVLAKVDDETYEVRLKPTLFKEEKDAAEERKNRLAELTKSLKQAEEERKAFGDHLRIVKNPKSPNWQDSFTKLNDRLNRNPPPLPLPPSEPKLDRNSRDVQLAAKLREKYLNDKLAYQTRLDEYKKNHIDTLIADAEKEIKTLQDKMTEYKAEKSKPSNDPMEKVQRMNRTATRISTVLYRVVDGVRVDAIIVGEPF
jgi:hypothetical protein